MWVFSCHLVLISKHLTNVNILLQIFVFDLFLCIWIHSDLPFLLYYYPDFNLRNNEGHWIFRNTTHQRVFLIFLFLLQIKRINPRRQKNDIFMSFTEHSACECR